MKKEIITAIIILVLIVLSVKLLSQEDDWICDDGDWVKHGVPIAPKPEGYCVDGKVNNFKECIAAGNPAMESYPRQCIHKGEGFVEVIGIHCIGESRKGGLCTDIGFPVCGLPVNKTYSNPCYACKDEQVLAYIEGECE